jgi:hypothetical protein
LGEPLRAMSLSAHAFRGPVVAPLSRAGDIAGDKLQLVRGQLEPLTPNQEVYMDKLYYCPAQHRLTTCHVLAECTEPAADPEEEEARHRFCLCYSTPKPRGPGSSSSPRTRRV